MHVINIISIVAYFLLLIVCAYTDYKRGKIYNKYLISFLLFFALIHCILYIVLLANGSKDVELLNVKLKDSGIGFLIGFVIGFIFYVLGVFKGGDAKLLAVVGLQVGGSGILYHYSTIMVIAGIGALYVLIKNKAFVRSFKRVFLYIKGIFLTASFNKYTSEEDDKIKFPFAVYILIGEMVAYINYIIRG